MNELKNIYNDYAYSYECRLEPKENLVIKMPVPKGNQKYVKGVYWAAEDGITVSATLAKNADSGYAIWEELNANSVVAPVITYIKFANTLSLYATMHLWVVME